MKSSVVVSGWLLEWIITKNFLPIYILDHRIPHNKSFFLYRWDICRLSFNQVTVIAVFMYCYFIILFIRSSLFIGLFIRNSINSMIIKVVISVTSVFMPLRTLGWVSLITRQQWLLSKFELCSSKESIKFSLLTTSFLKNVFSTYRDLTFCFSAHIPSFSSDPGFSVK